MKSASAFILGIILLMTCTAFMHRPTDYLAVPGPLNFDEEIYHLRWSQQTMQYYKQEYLRSGDTLENFNKMITIEVLVSNAHPKALAASKIQEIKDRKGKDPVANYEIRENEDGTEFLVDFLISDKKTYEWNAYRYKAIKTPKGEAILLFSYSLRSFDGADLSVNDFFAHLKTYRLPLIEKITNYDLPTITLN